MATQNISQIPAPRVPLVDVQMNTVSREWFMWFNNLYAITGTGTGITPVINGGTGLNTIPNNGQLLIGNGTGYALGTLTAGNGISVTNGAGSITVVNSLPDKVVSLTGAGATTVTGTYPNFTISSTVGVTSVAATVPSFLSISGSPITSSGTLAISYSATPLPVANGGTGTATPALVAGTNVTITGTWPNQTINASGGGSGSGTVTSVAALTLGTTGTDLSSTVATGTTTPVITLNVPTASATNRGALSAADWTTFNNKGSGTVTSVATAGTVNGLTLTGGPITASGTVTLGGTLDLSSPPAIGSTAASTGAFTTLSASSTVSGTGFSTYLASPPAIGGTAAAAGTFTTLTATGQTSLGGVTGSEGLRVNSVAGSTNWLDVTGSSANRVDVTALGPAGSNVALRLSSRGSQPVNLYTVAQTVLQFSVASTASAVNYVQVTGAATGGNPAITAQGSDAAINLVLSSKSTSAISFYTNNLSSNSRHLDIIHTSTVVNRFQITGSQTGNPVVLGVNGNDADIDITLTPKGAGRVNITTSIKPKVSSAANVTSPLAWNSTSFDEYAITALANALTINADANASPADGQKMLFRFKDNGTARALTWTTGATNAFRAVGITLPTTTVASKLVYIGCIYNAADSRWDAIAVSQEA
jgi:hypothetical protein